MKTDIDRLNADLQRLSQEAMDTLNLEHAALQAIRHKFLIRACAGLLNDMECERRQLIGRVELSFGAQPAAAPIEQREYEQFPRVARSRDPWSEQDYNEFNRILAGSRG